MPINFPEDTSFFKELQNLRDRIEQLERNISTPYSYTSYTPTWTNVTVGNGTQAFEWMAVGADIHVKGRLVLGSTSAVTGAPTFTLPATSIAVPQTRRSYPLATIVDSGTETFFGVIQLQSTTTAWVRTLLRSGADRVVGGAIDATNPMTWTTNDELLVDFWYQAA